MSHICNKVTGDKGISETKSKQQSPCSNCMHWPVMSWGNACSTCMLKPVRCMDRPATFKADPCTYCMGSKVSSLSRIYFYSSYFAFVMSIDIQQRKIALGIVDYSNTKTRALVAGTNKTNSLTRQVGQVNRCACLTAKKFVADTNKTNIHNETGSTCH